MKIYTAKTNSRLAQITAQITRDFSRSLDKKCYVFCEDKNTLSLEREIASLIGGSFNINVTSFSRYVSSKLSGGEVLSSTGSALVVYKVMSQLKDELKRLRLTNNPMLSANIYQLIAQLKSAKVKPSDLIKICQEEGGALATKLMDIYTIYDGYEKQVSEIGILDSNNSFALIPKLVKEDENLRGAKVVLVGFSSITKQISDIFVALDSVCDCDFVLLKGDGEFYTNEIYYRVAELFPSAITVEDSYILSQEQATIEKGLFSPEYLHKGGAYSDKVRIVNVSSPYQEAETVAKRIRYEVVKNKRRYKDFVICCAQPKAYAEIFNDIFSEYEIPLYVDQKRTMEKHPIIRFMASIMDTVWQNYLPSVVLALTSQRLVATQAEASAFERYISKNAISRKSIKQPFTLDDGCEKIRKAIFSLTDGIEKKMTARAYVGAFRSLLERENIYLKAKELGEKLQSLGLEEKASVNDKVIAKVERVFCDIENIIGDKTLSLMEFRTLLLSACAATEISILPLYNDVVYLGDFKSAKQREAKILFAIGMTDAVPDSKMDTALITDRDLVKMEKYKCVIEPKIKVVNRRERENVGVALMSFAEKLFVLYPTQSASFAPCNKSQVIDYLVAIFNLEIRSKKEARDSGLFSAENDIYGYMTKSAGFKNFALSVNDFKERDSSVIKGINTFYHSLSEEGRKKALLLAKEKVQEVLDTEVTSSLSASAIETYFSCPYSCFVKYNLKLVEDENGDVQAFEFGNILHLVLEKYVKAIGDVKDKQSSDLLSSSIYEQVINMPEYARYLNKSQYYHLFKLIKDEAKKRCYEIFSEYENSKFKFDGAEVSFGFLSGATIDAIELDTTKGKKYISGKVDRVDRYQNYFRIIDYKTGNASEKIKEEKLYSGTNIQLYLYSNAFLTKDSKIAGVYYYATSGDYDSDDKEKTEFFGKTLAETDVVLATDTRLEDVDKSPKYDITFSNKDGKRTIRDKKSMLSESELSSYISYAKKVAENGAEELLDGNIEPTPSKDACKYCKFNGMCGYDVETENKTREVKDVDKKKIIQAVIEKE